MLVFVLDACQWVVGADCRPALPLLMVPSPASSEETSENFIEVPLFPRAPLDAQTLPTPVREDTAYIRNLIDQLVKRSGLSQIEVSRRMGKDHDIIYAHRFKIVCPSMLWMVRLAIACGGRILVEFPKRAE